MSVNYAYGLYPWVWDAEQQCHRPPDGVVSCIDLRPITEQAVRGQSNGWGFFAWQTGKDVATELQIPADAIQLGVGDCRELRPTTTQRQNFRNAMGLTSDPDGEFLVDCLADVLGAKADPTGEAGPKPLLPAENELEIHLDGHSKVWSANYEPAKTLAATATGRANRIRDVLRQDLETAFDTGGVELVKKVLGSLLLKHGYSRAEIAGGAANKAAEWRRLLSPKMLARLGKDFKPSRPQTSYSDDFNRSDGAIGGNWNQILSSSGGYLFSADVVSNQLKVNINVASSYGSVTQAYTILRYDSDVSSSDHWTQYTLITTDGYSNTPRQMAPIVRCSSSANTFYSRVCTCNNGNETFRYFFKLVAGTATNIGSSSTNNGGFNQLYKLQVSGSTLRAWFYSVERTTTDTSITGNTRGGIYHYSTLATGGSSFDRYVTVDNWSVDDGLAATPAGPVIGRFGKTIGGRIFGGSVLT